MIPGLEALDRLRAGNRCFAEHALSDDDFLSHTRRQELVVVLGHSECGAVLATI